MLFPFLLIGRQICPRFNRLFGKSISPFLFALEIAISRGIIVIRNKLFLKRLHRLNLQALDSLARTEFHLLPVSISQSVQGVLCSQVAWWNIGYHTCLGIANERVFQHLRFEGKRNWVLSSSCLLHILELNNIYRRNSTWAGKPLLLPFCSSYQS